MTPEKLMDAMQLLPDDLLEQTDALRQKKRIPWRSLAATAACLCVAVGLWIAFPGAKTADSAAMSGAGKESIMEDFATAEDGSEVVGQQSSGSSCIALSTDRDFTVDRVCEDHVTACLRADGEFSVIIRFDNLERIPELRSGQRIRVYWQAGAAVDMGDHLEITPYKIEIQEEGQMKKLLTGIGAAVLLAAVCVAAWMINKRIHPNCDCVGPQKCECAPSVVIDEEDPQEPEKE